MAEEYTGDEGTEAAAAGMDVLDGTEDRRTGWLAINKTRDYLAAKLAAINWSSLIGKPTSFPNADVNEATAGAEAGKLVRYGTGGRVNVGEPTSAFNATTKSYVDGQSLRTGGTVNGPLTVTSNFGVDGNARVDGDLRLANATAATSGYTVAYINGDGRVSKGASSERYKKYISSIDPADLGDIWPDLHRFQMRQGDGDWKYGYIAERLAEHPDQQPFVVYAVHDGQLVPDSIDFIMLLMAQNAQLEQRLAALEARHEAD